MTEYHRTHPKAIVYYKNVLIGLFYGDGDPRNLGEIILQVENGSDVLYYHSGVQRVSISTTIREYSNEEIAYIHYLEPA